MVLDFCQSQQVENKFGHLKRNGYYMYTCISISQKAGFNQIITLPWVRMLASHQSKKNSLNIGRLPKEKTKEAYKFYISKHPTHHKNSIRSNSQTIDDLLLMGTQMEIRTILDLFMSSQSSLI